MKAHKEDYKKFYEITNKKIAFVINRLQIMRDDTIRDYHLNKKDSDINLAHNYQVLIDTLQGIGPV